MTLYPQQIIDALKTVRYPGSGKNIVEMGMVEDDLRIAGLHVSFSLLFDKPTNPFLKSLVKAAEAAIHAYVGKEVEVEVKTKTQSTPNAERAAGTLDFSNLGNIIAVSSGKGGVGKSTVAANLAVGLARLGHRVGLLDCDIFGPSVPKMFQIEGEQIYSEERDGKTLIIPAEKYGVKLLSIGFFVDAATPTLWRGGMASNALKQLIGEVAWGDLDYFILDTPPGTSDIHLTLVQTLPITGAVIVSTPQQVALADARKGLNMYTNEKVNVPILGLVENMSKPMCPCWRRFRSCRASARAVMPANQPPWIPPHPWEMPSCSWQRAWSHRPISAMQSWQKRRLCTHIDINNVKNTLFSGKNLEL